MTVLNFGTDMWGLDAKQLDKLLLSITQTDAGPFVFTIAAAESEK